MEKEYIERDSIYSRIKRHTNPYGKPTLDYESGVKVLDMIKLEPAADVVKVVRCKDCIHYQEILHHTTKEPIGLGKCDAIEMDIDLKQYDFCSRGDRKEHQ